MKLRLLLASLVIALSAGTLVHAEEDHTPLENQMSSMNRAFRQLKKQVSDEAQNASSLELVAKIKQGAEGSVELIPAMTADLPESERAAFVTKYQVEMKKFIAVVDELETALKAGNTEEAAKLVSAMSKLQRSGHNEFRKEE